MIRGGDGGKEEKRKEGMEGENQRDGCSQVISHGEVFKNKCAD